MIGVALQDMLSVGHRRTRPCHIAVHALRTRRLAIKATHVRKSRRWERCPEQLFIFFVAEAKPTHTGTNQPKSRSGASIGICPPVIAYPRSAPALPTNPRPRPYRRARWPSLVRIRPYPTPYRASSSWTGLRNEGGQIRLLNAGFWLVLRRGLVGVFFSACRYVTRLITDPASKIGR